MSFHAPPELRPMTTLAPPPPAAPPAVRPLTRRREPLSEREMRLRGLPADGAEMSADAFVRLSLGENLLMERVDGRLEYLPMPSRTHQAVVWGLSDGLGDFARSEGMTPEIIFAPFIVRVNGRDRQPDVCFLKDADDPRAGETMWTGADLLVEVVSPDDPRRDTEDKRADYAAAGVREYWLIDPRPGFRTITVLEFDDGAYRGEPIGDGGTAASALLPGFAVDVTACLDGR